MKQSILLLFVLVMLSGGVTAQSVQTEILIADSTMFVNDLAVIDDWLFVQSRGTEYQVRAYDIHTGALKYEFGTEGRGPAEYLSISIHRGPGANTLEIADQGNRKNEVFDFDCLKKKPEPNLVYRCIIQTEKNQASRHSIIVKDDLVLNHGREPEGVVYTGKGDLITEYLFTTPKQIEELYKKPVHKALSQTGLLAANSARTHFAYFADSFDKAVFMQFNGETISVINETVPTFWPLFKVNDFGASSFMEEDEEYRFAYNYPSAGNKHYYVLYSGKSKAEETRTEGANWLACTNRIEIFSFEGDKVGEFYSDRELFMLEVDEEEHYFYGLEIDESFNPIVIKGQIPEWR